MTLVIDITCKGSSSGQRVFLEDGETLYVGRANESLDLRTDPRLSRKHFLLRYHNREVEITHLSRTNPTLVASDGSTDFVEVTGKHVEPRGCRIIAGAHRFVAVVEAPDSIIEPTLSGEDQAEIWSDVDSEEEQNPFFFDSFPEPNKNVQSLEKAPVQATIPGSNIKPTSPSAVPRATPARPNLPHEDSLPDTPAAPSPSSETKPKPPPAPKTDKKIFFPIEDDFFD